MAKVTMNVTEEDIEQAGKGGEFALPPVGYYVLDLTECEPGFSKNDDGDEDKNRPYLKCTYAITGVGREDAKVEATYGNVWDYVVMSVGWKKAEFMEAMGLEVVAGKDVEFDTDELVGTRVLARIKHENGQEKDDPKRPRIGKLLPFGEAADAKANGPVNLDEATNPFDDESEVEDLLTEEQLQEEDLKSLGTIAKEFDLDPNSFLVKKNGKVDTDATKTAVIEAILEAQGEPEEGDDSAEEEDSPF